MKKTVALLLAGALALSLIACGSGENSENKQATETVASAVGESGQQESQTVQEPVEEPSAEEPALPEGSLKEVFAEHGMKVGTCINPQMIKNSKLNQIILDQFSSATMENAMKPDYILSKAKSIEADDLVVEFNQDMLAMLEWAKENNMPMRGHTLVWYSQTPNWIFYEGFDPKNELVGREKMLARMESYIRQMFEKLEEGGYADLFYAYDVANEAWMEDGSMRNNLWSQTIGEDYLWYAFYYADQYAPEHIELYYNDYNEQFKTKTLVDFVATLVDENGEYLIDGVGFQGHLYTSDDLKAYFKTVDALAATGLKVEITELDVSLGAWQKTLVANDENLRAQGKFYYDLVNGIFERVDAGTLNMDSLTIWGFTDAMSWRSEANPVLYNKLLEPKYAYYGVLQMKEYAGFE